MLESSDFLLKVSQWYFTNKKHLKTFMIVVLLFSNVLIWFNVAIKGIPYALNTSKHQRLTEEMKILAVDFEGYKSKHRVEELIIKDTVTVSAKTNTYNILSKIENSNKEWVAEVIRYHFELPGLNTDQMKSFVLPNQTKALTSYNVSYATSNITPPTAKLVIEKIHWHRYSPTNPLIIPDFKIENVQHSAFTPMAPLGEENAPSIGTNNVTRVQADITNKSLYGFWRVDAQILVLDHVNDILDFNTLRLTEFRAGEKKHIDVSFKKPLLNVTNIEFFSEVDTFDPSAVMPLGPGSSQPL